MTKKVLILSVLIGTLKVTVAKSLLILLQGIIGIVMLNILKVDYSLLVFWIGILIINLLGIFIKSMVILYSKFEYAENNGLTIVEYLSNQERVDYRNMKLVTLNILIYLFSFLILFVKLIGLDLDTSLLMMLLLTLEGVSTTIL